jgi:hypothetical protein
MSNGHKVTAFPSSQMSDDHKVANSISKSGQDSKDHQHVQWSQGNSNPPPSRQIPPFLAVLSYDYKVTELPAPPLLQSKQDRQISSMSTLSNSRKVTASLLASVLLKQSANKGEKIA